MRKREAVSIESPRSHAKDVRIREVEQPAEAREDRVAVGGAAEASETWVWCFVDERELFA